MIFEDEHLAVVSKPPGIVCEAIPPTAAWPYGLTDLMRMGSADSSFFLCHRIDADTSGVLVMAKTKEAERKMRAIFQRREIKKSYIALVADAWNPEVRTVNAPLTKRVPVRVDFDDKEARRAVTHFVKAVPLRGPNGEIVTMTAIDLDTGRTHQIRVHAKYAAAPLSGDKKYGGLRGKIVASRQFLHCYRVAFRHPFTGEDLQLKANLPADLAEFLRNFQPLPGFYPEGVLGRK